MSDAPIYRKVLVSTLAAVLVLGFTLLAPQAAYADPEDLDPTFGDPNIDYSVRAMILQPDGKVLIGGTFTSVGGQTRNRVARLNADGTLDTTFIDPNVDAVVSALVLQPDGKILIGGGFISVGGQSRYHLARLNADGSLDPTFGNPSIDGMVYAMALQPDGKILIGGGFTLVDWQTRNSVARMNADGTIDPTFGDPDVDDGVYALVRQPDGKVLIGGYFMWVGGELHVRVARLNANGTLDTTFSNPGIDDMVFTLALQPDGKVLVGGDFTSVSGQTRRRVARLDANGTLDTTFGDPDVYDTVQVLVLQPDGKVLIGGDFLWAGESRFHIARLNADSTLDTTFGNPSAGDNVHALVLQTDGKILAGGDFSSMGGLTRNRVARLEGDPPPVAVDDIYGTHEHNAPSTFDVLANDTNAVLIERVGTPVYGSVAISGTTELVYTPTNRTNSYTDVFDYVAGNGCLVTDTATVTVTVIADNDPPLAANDTYNVAENGVLTVPAPGVLANDSDPDEDGPGLSAGLLIPPVGALSFDSQGSFVYTPTHGFTGQDNFTYIADDSVMTDTAMVLLNVQGPVTETVVVSETGTYTFKDICGSITFTNTGSVKTFTVTLSYDYPSVNRDGLPRRYDIVADGSGFNAMLTLCYEDNDLLVAGINPGQEPNLHAYRYSSGGMWQEYSRVDTINNTVTAFEVNELGRWGMGIGGDRPTALALDVLIVRSSLWATGLLAVVGAVIALRRKRRESESRPAAP